MHVSDIREAIAKGTTSDIEDAFRALVLWPGEDRIEGLDTAAQAEALLNDVGHALVVGHDSRIMPVGVVDFIQNETGRTMSHTSYAAGALAVAMHVSRWRSFFEADFAKRGG